MNDADDKLERIIARLEEKSLGTGVLHYQGDVSWLVGELKRVRKKLSNTERKLTWAKKKENPSESYGATLLNLSRAGKIGAAKGWANKTKQQKSEHGKMMARKRFENLKTKGGL